MLIIAMLSGVAIGFILAVAIAVIIVRFVPDRQAAKPRFAAIASGEVLDLDGGRDQFRNGIWATPRGWRAPEGIA
jgi:hypothetical protein